MANVRSLLRKCLHTLYMFHIRICQGMGGGICPLLIPIFSWKFVNNDSGKSYPFFNLLYGVHVHTMQRACPTFVVILSHYLWADTPIPPPSILRPVLFCRHFAKDGSGVIERSKVGRIAELCANKVSINNCLQKLHDIRRIRFLITKSARETLYKALGLPVIEYCNCNFF